MALTKAKRRITRLPDSNPTRGMQVAASVEIFAGAIVAMDASGFAIPAPATQDAEFAGIAKEGFDNSASLTETDEKELEIEAGHLEKILLNTTPALTDIGKAVYYVDDEKVTFTAPADLTTRVGTIWDLAGGDFVSVLVIAQVDKT